MRPLRTAFSFFTILPLGRGAELNEVAESCYCLPLVAVAVGAVAGIAGWGGTELLGAPVGAALALSVSLLLTGLHHVDGLGDFGDALMARGGPERRVAVLKDRTMGTGAVGALLMVYLLSWASLSQLFVMSGGGRIVGYLIAAELAARLAMLTNATISKTSHPGSGSAFLLAARSWRGVFGITAAIGGLLAASIFLDPAPLLLAGVAALLTAAAMSFAGHEWFGGVGGDLLGATLELGRMAALMGMVAALKAWPPV